MQACVVLTTVGGLKAAERLADSLVSKKLAVCVTVIPGVLSRYRWKGKVQRSREALLLIKTSRGLRPRILRFLRSNHPYDVPEALALPVSWGSKEYLSWLGDSLEK